MSEELTDLDYECCDEHEVSYIGECPQCVVGDALQSLQSTIAKQEADIAELVGLVNRADRSLYSSQTMYEESTLYKDIQAAQAKHAGENNDTTRND